jgi:hypothetical protein
VVWLCSVIGRLCDATALPSGAVKVLLGRPVVLQVCSEREQESVAYVLQTAAVAVCVVLMACQ